MPGTEASKMKQLPGSITKIRSKQLSDLFKKNAFYENKKVIGSEYLVYVSEKGIKNAYIGMNMFYKQVIIKSKKNLLGKYLFVRITDATSFYLIGEIIKKKN